METPNFSFLIRPLSTEEFRDKYWLQQHLHLQRDPEDYYDRLLNLDDIDTLLENENLPPSLFRLIKEGDQPTRDNYSGSKKYERTNEIIADNQKLFGYLNQGYTIEIYLAQRIIPKFTRFFDGLIGELPMRHTAKLFVTPPGTWALEAHMDQMEVFVCQLHGTKTWSLYDWPIKSPTEDQRSQFKEYTQNLEDKPAHQMTLTPGDLLYVPAGMIHKARTNDEFSVQISIGFYTNRWSDLLKNMAGEFAQAEVFRSPLPDGLLNPMDPKAFERSFKQAVKEMIDNTDIQAYLSSFNFDPEKYPYPDLRGVFKDILLVDKIRPETVVARRQLPDLSMTRQNGMLEISVQSKKSTFPKLLAPAIERLLDDRPVAIGSIQQNIADEMKIELARKFIRFGWLRIEQL